jgi:hypothetical protein
MHKSTTAKLRMGGIPLPPVIEINFDSKLQRGSVNANAKKESRIVQLDSRRRKEVWFGNRRIATLRIYSKKGRAKSYLDVLECDKSSPTEREFRRPWEYFEKG